MLEAACVLVSAPRRRWRRPARRRRRRAAGQRRFRRGNDVLRLRSRHSSPRRCSGERRQARRATGSSPAYGILARFGRRPSGSQLAAFTAPANTAIGAARRRGDGRAQERPLRRRRRPPPEYAAAAAARFMVTPHLDLTRGRGDALPARRAVLVLRPRTSLPASFRSRCRGTSTRSQPHRHRRDGSRRPRRTHWRYVEWHARNKTALRPEWGAPLLGIERYPTTAATWARVWRRRRRRQLGGGRRAAARGDGAR